MLKQTAPAHPFRFRLMPNNIVRCILCAALAMSAGACSSSDTDEQASQDAVSKDTVSQDTVSQDTAFQDTDQADHDAADAVTKEPTQLRIATFNTSLFRATDGALRSDLSGGEDPQARRVAEVIQRNRPDIILLNEFDWDADGESAQIFVQQYLQVAQNGATEIDYPYHYVPTTNTGVSSGVDLNNNGQTVTTPGSQAYGDDSFGFGQFPGQYGMVVLSRYPVMDEKVRSFQDFLWQDMPDNLQPTDFYSAEALDVMRLSSKNHVDVVIDVEGSPLHLLISHPTPPSFDGPEDRNGRRNHDEIKLWVDYISGAETSAYLTDDNGTNGGLGEEPFVLLGDLNLDPKDGDSRHEVINSLLDHPRVHDPEPSSDGAVEANELDGRANTTHQGDPALDTADFSDHQVGNLRVDYALPSTDLGLIDQGVFWPATDAEHASLADASDHHMVWVDLELAHP